MILITVAFVLFDRKNVLTLAASVIGVTSLLFNAKGNPFGQTLMVVFSILYGIISFSFSYYGEMITNIGMMMPLAIFFLASWLKHLMTGKDRRSGSITCGKKRSFLCGCFPFS